MSGSTFKDSFTKCPVAFSRVASAEVTDSPSEDATWSLKEANKSICRLKV